MIKVSRLADYAVVVLVTLAESPDELMTACGVSGKTGLPEPTVAKVLKLLSKAGIVCSTRGANGGYAPCKGAYDISVADVIQAVDGPISLTACSDTSGESCDYACACPVSGRWNSVNTMILEALEGYKIADMMQGGPFGQMKNPAKDEGKRLQ